MRGSGGAGEAGATFPRQEEALMIIPSRSVPTVAAALLLGIAVAGCGGTASSSSVAPQSGTGTQRTTPPPIGDSTGGSSNSSSDGIVVSAGKKIGAAAYLKSI